MSRNVRVLILLYSITVLGSNCAAQSSDVDDLSPVEPAIVTPAEPVIPMAPIIPSGPDVRSEPEPSGIDWNALLRESFAFLSLEHGFRYLTEPGTRRPHTALIRGYVDSLNNLHGWGDGDPFIVNYVGHPMQGAVAGFLFAQNDRKYRMVEFGKNRWYWRSRLRAAAYTWAYSEQFELGPISEATIGHTQAFFPQQGFVDQVATPTIGMAWMIVEDALDRYVIERIEQRVHNGVVRTLIRGGLNPSRSMANAMSFAVPWHRINRTDPWEPSRQELLHVRPKPVHGEGETYPTVAPFELTMNARALGAFGPGARGSCVGGGAMAAFRVSTNWQLVGDVGGCKMTHFGDNFSGDSLTYMVGPRWTGNPEKQWEPFAQLLIGGRTLTHEQIDPDKKAQVDALAAQDGKTLDFAAHRKYTTRSESTGLAVSANAGVDVKLNPAIAFRVVDLGYMHSWHSSVDGVNYGNNVQLSAGLVLRLGTW